jgi:hypothetical protein
MGQSCPQVFESGREKFQFDVAVAHSLLRAWSGRHPSADLARDMRAASQPMSESGASKSHSKFVAIALRRTEKRNQIYEMTASVNSGQREPNPASAHQQLRQMLCIAPFRLRS